MAFLDENGVGQLWAAVKDRLADAFNSVEFDVAEQAANLVSGDSIATAFGKLAKNYTSLLTSISDLNTNLTSQINTKLNKSDVLANYTTTATGKALDASLGPAIREKMDLADTLNTKVDRITYNRIEDLSALIEFCNTMKSGEVRPIWIGANIMSSIYGISGVNGPGIIIKHTATVVDLLAIDSIMRYCRFNPTNSSFGRKYSFTGVSVN